jgi:phytoene desaturase
MKKVGIIGAGVAGITAAAILAKAGYNVEVFEKNNQAGGRARVFKDSGFTFDMGPSWYWMPEVFESFFENFGKKTKDYYSLKRLDPSYKVFYNNDTIPIPATLDQVLQLFEFLEEGSSSTVKQFLKKAETKYTTSMAHYINKPSHSITEFLDLKILTSFLKLSLFSSIRSEIKKVTNNPKIRQILEFPILFLGATPDNTPALYSMMNHVDTNLGTWYPMGGMGEMIKAMVTVAEEQGVRFRYNTEIEKVEIKNRKIISLKTDSHSFDIDNVVCGMDYHFFEQSVLNKEDRMYDEKYWDNRTMSPSVLLFYLGVDTILPNLEHHNLFFDADFEKHIGEIYSDPKWPTDPLFYVCAPSKTDETVAPKGMENIFILIPIANDLKQNDELIENYFEIICQRLMKKTGVDISKHLVVKRSYSVKEFKEDYHAFKGNAYGLANTLMQTAIFKPKMKSNKIDNLFYTGQLTVPGPGMPPSIISGQIVANEIIHS